jgi:hypothetical protein
MTVFVEPDGTTTALLSLRGESVGHHTDTVDAPFPTTAVPTPTPKQ